MCSLTSRAKHDFFTFLNSLLQIGTKIQISLNSYRGKWFHETELWGLYLHCKDRLFVDLVKMGGKWERLLRFSHFCTELKSCILFSVLALHFRLNFMKIKPCIYQRILPVRYYWSVLFLVIFLIADLIYRRLPPEKKLQWLGRLKVWAFFCLNH